MVAIEYALRYPQSLSHLILVDTCGDIRWAQENAPKVLTNRGFDPETVELARRFFNGEIKPEEMKLAMRKFGRAYYHHPSPLLLIREAILGLRMKVRTDALIFGFSQLLRGWTVMNRLNEITIPTLILAGRHDFQFPPEHQNSLANRIPNARLKIIEGAGHNAHSEQTNVVIEEIKHFLKNADLGGN
jgi:proline iminopeptidase